MKKYCLLFLITIALAHVASAQKLVLGKVSESNGTALPGANVYIKGTSLGTSTDAEGKFALQVPAEYNNAVIIISLIGYKTQEVSAV
ncbi:MAG: carboxypeptidase-like regulatory domain-containing protein, partial [Cyclobacteriaceae bacterium]|nr:carboxypeptidase-like regulatory domain-containing protein [Cyclobacteriaceae bacterium]